MSGSSQTSMFLYSVGQLLTYLRELLESDVFLSDVWVGGQIVNLTRSQAGHIYFTLKDDTGGMRCVLFARQALMVRMAMENGAQVMVHGRVAIYEPRGDLQLIADFVRPEGVGVEQARFEQLVAKLEAEGLFDPARKRALPAFPERIGVVTSRHGAVWHDICRVIERRWPLVELVLAETTVQGEAALAGVPDAIARLNATPGIDVIIVARGGGAAEEIAVFNDETIARAIFGSVVPVISAIGHETDTTIADMVADLRAPTPSVAAELVVPDRRDVLAWAERAALVMSANVAALAGQRIATVQLMEQEIGRELSTRVADATAQLAARTTQLATLSPLATLARGYAVVRRVQDGHVLISASDAKAGTALDLRLADGSLRADVV